MKNSTIISKSTMYIISKTTNREFCQNIEKLHLIIPAYMSDDEAEDMTNPFMDYVIEKDYIQWDLYEFLYHSDFLQLLTEETNNVAIQFYENNADIGWFEILQSIQDMSQEDEDKHENISEYCKVILECFQTNISVKLVQLIMEMSSSVAQMKENIDKVPLIFGENADDADKCSSPGLGESKEAIADLEKKNQELSGLLDGYVQELDKAHLSEYELKSQIVSLMSEKENTKQIYEKMEGMIHSCKKALEMYVERIHVLENQLVSKDDELSEAQASLEEQATLIEESKQEIARIREESKKNATLAERYHEELIRIAEEKVVEKDNHDNTDEISRSSSEEYDVGNDMADDHTVNKDPMDNNIESMEVADIETPDPRNEEIYQFSDVQPAENHGNVIKRIGGAFKGFLFKHSEKFFVDRPREEQVNLVKFKMATMQFPKEKVMFVKTRLDNDDTVPCFELYKLISQNPSEDDLRNFFDDYGVNAAIA